MSKGDPNGEALLRNVVGRFKAAFYPEDEKLFYQHLPLLRRAASWPAKFIRDHGAGEFPAAKYEAIMAEVILKVKIHGADPATMRHRGAYLLKAVQDHWRHHWEDYADEAKRAADAVAREVRELSATGTAAAPTPTATMAQIHRALTTGRPKGRKTQKDKRPQPIQIAPSQRELFPLEF